MSTIINQKQIKAKAQNFLETVRNTWAGSKGLHKQAYAIPITWTLGLDVGVSFSNWLLPLLTVLETLLVSDKLRIIFTAANFPWPVRKFSHFYVKSAVQYCLAVQVENEKLTLVHASQGKKRNRGDPALTHDCVLLWQVTQKVALILWQYRFNRNSIFIAKSEWIFT